MARLAGNQKYMLARKAHKLYMPDALEVKVHSITTTKEQMLCIDKEDAALMKGKRILIVDDVISTGESLKALETLVEKAGGHICGRLTILAEGDGVVTKVDATSITVSYDGSETKTYKLTKFLRSNHGTCINQRPIVRGRARRPPPG